MISKEKVQELIKRAYSIAATHGFHEVDRSNAHFLMLVVSEIGEIVEADRKGRYYKKLSEQARLQCGKSQDTPHLSKYLFEKYVKDSVEDELADVCIRLFDYLGNRGIEPVIFGLEDDGMFDAWKTLFGKNTVCEQCFWLARIITKVEEDTPNDEIATIIGSALQWCYDFARFHAIDLPWHIDRKMDFNESRANKHGKSY